MNIVRRLCPAVLVLFIVLAATAVAGSSASKGQTDGIFAGVEQGDYAHFLVETGKGKQDSFFVLRPDKSVQPFLDNAAKMKGRKVRVHWEERSENIPEAGGKQQIKVVTKVETRS